MSGLLPVPLAIDTVHAQYLLALMHGALRSPPRTVTPVEKHSRPRLICFRSGPRLDRLGRDIDALGTSRQLTPHEFRRLTLDLGHTLAEEQDQLRATPHGANDAVQAKHLLADSHELTHYTPHFRPLQKAAGAQAVPSPPYPLGRRGLAAYGHRFKGCPPTRLIPAAFLRCWFLHRMPDRPTRLQIHDLLKQCGPSIRAPAQRQQPWRLPPGLANFRLQT